jgi:predicted dehydrogenase
LKHAACGLKQNSVHTIFKKERKMSVNVALIGFAGHWSHALEGIQELEDVKWTCYAPGGPEEDHGGIPEHPAYSPAIKKYDKWQDLLSKENIQVAVITPCFYRTSEIAREFAESSIHVLCEKPLAITHEGLEKLKAAVRKNNVRCGVLLGMRLSPAFYTAYRAVRNGRIGEPLHAYGQKSYKLGQRPDWMRKRKTFGGTIPWVGIHAIDFVRWITGLEYVSVTAHHANLANPDHDELEDSAVALFRFNNGGFAEISMDYLRPGSAPSHGDDRIRVAGSSGVIEVIHEKTYLIDDKGEHELEPEIPPPLFTDFYNSVYRGTTPVIGHEDGFKLTEIALKTRDAADQQRSVEL